MNRICICIPTFNNPDTIRNVVERCLAATPFPVIVVDDGSALPARELLASVPEANPSWSDRLTLIRLPANTGKGNALLAGFRHAAARGFSGALACDGDGQHFPEDLPLLAAAAGKDEALVIGCREMHPANSPWISRLGRYLSNCAVRWATGFWPVDSQSGMRLYPLRPLQRLSLLGGRFEFELEVLVKLLRAGAPLRCVPVRVFYPHPRERISHFRKVRDNLRITLLFGKLVGESCHVSGARPFLPSLFAVPKSRAARHRWTADAGSSPGSGERPAWPPDRRA